MRALAAAVALQACAMGAAAQEVIVDNLDTGFSILEGTWTTSGTPGGWPGGTGNFRTAFTADPASAATHVCEWRPTLPTAGLYEVFVWHAAGANRANDAPFTVTYADGSWTVPVDQTTDGSTWLSIGVYAFDAGAGGTVTLRNTAEYHGGSPLRVVIGDAVRFVAVPPGSLEMRSVWCSRFQWATSANRTTVQTNIRNVMTNLANNNFNAVLFQVRGQCDTLYPSPQEPWSPLITSPDGVDPGWDPLAYAVDQAHTRGVQLHAYINTHTCWGSASPPSYAPSHIYFQHANPNDPAHRDWLLHDSDGTPVGHDGEYVWLNPGVPACDAFVRAQIMHVVRTYAVDGVHFDRVRLPDPGYGRNPIAVARWDNPVTPAANDGQGNPGRLGWDDFMRDAVTRAMINITGEGWSINPRAVVSSAPLGLWRADAYPGYPTYYFYGYPRAQDAKAWMMAGAMDFIVPQIYWNNDGVRPEFSDLYPTGRRPPTRPGASLCPARTTATAARRIPMACWAPRTKRSKLGPAAPRATICGTRPTSRTRLGPRPVIPTSTPRRCRRTRGGRPRG